MKIPTTTRSEDQWLELVRREVRAFRFGVMELAVVDGGFRDAGDGEGAGVLGRGEVERAFAAGEVDEIASGGSVVDVESGEVGVGAGGIEGCISRGRIGRRGREGWVWRCGWRAMATGRSRSRD